ncbi:hypothetical protein RIF29_28936 [Crotalaria pallida]|uniref:Uncharacterized protein n=1 Tax=Crotalaria pallida TaxID=3830 RepID=A0AAN9EE22_CROPI
MEGSRGDGATGKVGGRELLLLDEDSRLIDQRMKSIFTHPVHALFIFHVSSALCPLLVSRFDTRLPFALLLVASKGQGHKSFSPLRVLPRCPGTFTLLVFESKLWVAKSIAILCMLWGSVTVQYPHCPFKILMGGIPCPLDPCNSLHFMGVIVSSAMCSDCPLLFQFYRQSG